MKYIHHDTSAIDDEKLSELIIEFGYEGYGLFWAILEKIGKQEKPVKTSVLKKQLHVGKRLEKCWLFMERIGLINSLNGETFNKQLLNYAGKYQIKKEKNAERISEWRKNKQVTENVTHYEQDCNASVTPPNISKENRSKVKGVENASLTLESSKKNPAVLFRESDIFDKAVFAEKLSNTQYSLANIEYYHEIINNWSDSKNNKKTNWLAAAKNWMAKDMTEGKFIKNDFKPHANGQSATRNGQQPNGLNAAYKADLARRMAEASSGGTGSGH